jgi:hypothetical protein
VPPKPIVPSVTTEMRRPVRPSCRYSIRSSSQIEMPLPADWPGRGSHPHRPCQSRQDQLCQDRRVGCRLQAISRSFRNAIMYSWFKSPLRHRFWGNSTHRLHTWHPDCRAGIPAGRSDRCRSPGGRAGRSRRSIPRPEIDRWAAVIARQLQGERLIGALIPPSLPRPQPPPAPLPVLPTRPCSPAPDAAVKTAGMPPSPISFVGQHSGPHEPVLSHGCYIQVFESPRHQLCGEFPRSAPRSLRTLCGRGSGDQVWGSPLRGVPVG